MNTLINASTELGWYDFSQVMNGNTVNNYIGGFSQAFGTSTEVRVACRPVRGSTKITLDSTRGISKLNGLVDLHVQNPFADEDRDMDAVYVQVAVEAKLHLDITEDYKIAGQFTDIQTEVKDFRTYFYSFTTIDGLSAQMSVLNYWLISYLNETLNAGLELPVPEWLIAPLSKPRFRKYADGYFLVDTEPKENNGGSSSGKSKSPRMPTDHVTAFLQ